MERATDLYQMVGMGQLIDAFEKYYAEYVVMEEPRGTRKGKEACREAELQFLESVQEFHGMEIKAISEDDTKGKVLVEVSMDMTFKGDQRMVMEQVAVQQWENGQITHERFYYNNQG